MNKWVYLGILLLLTSLGSPNYIIVTAQLNPPQPTTAQWYVKEGDAISWHVAKLRENGNITFTDLFYNYTTGESLNVTEGDTITITVLTLGNAREYEGTCQIQNGEKQISRRLVNTWIHPIFDRDYWVNFVAWSENQTVGNKYTLQGNLLTTISSLSSRYSKTVLDISTGLVHGFQSSEWSYPNITEIDINIVTGFWFPNITLPTLLLAGVIGAEIILMVFLVRWIRKRKLESS